MNHLNHSSKICLLGDTHFNARGNSPIFHKHNQKFYSEVFIPYLLNNNIKVVIQLGDLFDTRKQINLQGLHESRQYFFDELRKNDIQLITLLGNHCVYFKNTLEVNSSELLLRDYDNVKVFSGFGTIEVCGIKLDIVPWICDANQEDIFQKMKSSRSEICVGHFEINGFEMDRGNVFEGGTLDTKKLKKYDMVLSGHFHHKSSDNHIYYLGTPVELTWSDWNDPKGFHIFDVNTRELEFIKNPFTMFHKMTYDDTNEESNKNFWKSFDYTTLKDAYVKIVVVKKTDLYFFDIVVDNLYKAGVADVSFVEDFTDSEETVASDLEWDSEIVQAEDTITSLNKYIDSQKIQVKPARLKGIMREVYIEALNKDKAA